MSMNYAFQALIKLNAKGVEAVALFLSKRGEDGPWSSLAEKYRGVMAYTKEVSGSSPSAIPFRRYADGVQGAPFDRERGLWAISCQLHSHDGRKLAEAFCRHILPEFAERASVLLCYEESENTFDRFSFDAKNGSLAITPWVEVDLCKEDSQRRIIEQAALSHEDLDDQNSSTLNEIETLLMERRILHGKKVFCAP